MKTGGIMTGQGYGIKTLHLALFTLIIIHYVPALEYLEGCLGTDKSLSMVHRLTSNTSFCYKLYSLRGENADCNNGTIDTEALTPSQGDRFSISSSRNGNDLILVLSITDLQREDHGVYIFKVIEINLTGHISEHILDVYIDVLLPPGTAECDVERSAYSSTLREVHCSATLGSDGGGFLVCFQNKEKVPFLSAIQRSSTHIKMIFWMDVKNPIKCCSHAVDVDPTEKNCKDFEYTDKDHIFSTTSKMQERDTASTMIPPPKTSLEHTTKETQGSIKVTDNPFIKTTKNCGRKPYTSLAIILTGLLICLYV